MPHLRLILFVFSSSLLYVSFCSLLELSASTLPRELGELRQLEVIDLYANQISGTIPSELGKLKQLKSLDLHDNNLVRQGLLFCSVVLLLGFV